MSKFKKFSIRITNDHIVAMRAHRFYLTVEKNWSRVWLKPGAKITFTAPVEVEPYAAQRVGPTFCTLGAFSYTRSAFPCSTIIGRYCAIADRIDILGPNHPMNRLSMCGFDYSTRSIYRDPLIHSGKKFAKQKLDRPVRMPIIGNDVWIGSNVTFAQGVRVGHGAVIGANTLVTKDVPDYAIVVGHPGKVKRYRFPEPLIDRLLRSQWWSYSFVDFGGMNTLDPVAFLDELEERVSAGTIAPYQPEKIRLHELLRAATPATAVEPADNPVEEDD